MDAIGDHAGGRTLTALAIHDLWKSYNGRPAVRGLDLEVRPGELLALLGPNGAGKTTTIKVVVGLLSMDRGTVLVDGQDIAQDPLSYKARVGYAPEDPSLPEYLTAEEFLGYVARIRGLDTVTRQRRIDGLLRDLDLQAKRDELVVTLSRGMKQKLALASALLHEPSLVLLDEPLTAIDPAGQRRIKEMLRDIADGGAGVLVSTHMLDTAERLCDRVTIIHRGSRVAAGTLGELRETAQAGDVATLEEVFLRLTQEAREPEPEAPPRLRRFWGRR